MSDRLLKTHPLHAYARVALRHLQHGWQRLREFGHGLRVAGIASFSVGLGLFIYWAVPQAQDLFLEIFGSWGTATLYWMFFYGMVVVAWVLPVYLSSRWILARYNALAYTSTEDDLIPVPRWVVRLLPVMLGTLCMVAVLIGQWEAIISAPQTGYVCGGASGKTFGCGNEIKTYAREIFEKISDASLGDLPMTVTGLVVTVALLGGLVLLIVGGGVLGLCCLHCGPVSRIIKIAERKLSQVFVWLCGFGLIAWILKLVFYDSLLGGGAVAVLFAIVLSLLFRSSPFPRVDAVTWGEDGSRAVTVFFNGAGTIGQFVLLVAILATPIVLALAIMYWRRAATIAGTGLRRSVRLAMILIIVSQVAVGGLALMILVRVWPLMRAEVADPFSIVSLMGLPMISLALVGTVWWALRWHSDQTAGYAVRTTVPTGAFQRVLIIATLALLATVLPDPNRLIQYINRAPLLPVILGVWIPILTLVQAASIRSRVPMLLLSVVAALIVLPALLGEPHTVRTVVVDAPVIRPTLEESVRRWKAVNQCETQSKEDKAPTVAPEKLCPPPIIVLASGGASRAAFKVAETLGVLANRADEFAAAQERPDGLPVNYRSFQNRLFAISGVSGGALAAVTYQATLAEALLARTGDAPVRPPCVKPKPDSDWFGWVTLGDERPVMPDLGWNSCMELVLAGDFLSPTVVGLVGADLINIRPYGDRAAILEQAWERQFKMVTGKNTLAEPLVSLRKKVLDADPRNWLPLLLLNGTSVTTGRRIIVSDVQPHYGYEAGCNAVPADVEATCENIHSDAYDLHTLLNEGDHGVDIRLSTAATLSARFPVLSPNGILRGPNGAVVDRVVDGGYFDNNGAYTALELAQALGAQGLQAGILLIRNDPRDEPLNCEADNLTPAVPKFGHGGYFGAVLSPFDAAASTRSAHGTLTAQRLCQLRTNREFVGRYNQNGGTFDSVGVDNDADLFGNKQLSMSWWLSKHVQRRLTQYPARGTWEWRAIGLAPPPAVQISP